MTIVVCLLRPSGRINILKYDNEVISVITLSPNPSPLHQNLEEGGDSLSESANHMMPPPTTSLGNLSSLDITNDEELPTDPSNSSDTQEESECYLSEQTTNKKPVDFRLDSHTHI